MHAPVPYSRHRPPVAVSPLIRDDVALSQIAADDWNQLAGGLPLLSHQYFSALHRTRCAAPETGWTPRFLTAWNQSQLIGAMPLYAKSHSYGEYVFDWGWADAYRRYGRRYYPKLVAAIPFTPVPGPRLIADDRDAPPLLERALGRCGTASHRCTCCSPMKAGARGRRRGHADPRRPAVPLAQPRLPGFRRFPRRVQS
jgi:predicted N-acyltransferase